MKALVTLAAALAMLSAGSAAEAEEGWITAENQPCQMYNLGNQPQETVTWSGACVDGKASGRGRAVWRAHEYGEIVVEGEYRDGKEHGHGVLTNKRSGTRYEGEFRDGKFHGHGVKTWIAVPVGKSEEGKVLYRLVGDWRYEGEFRDDKFHGRGSMTDDIGTRHEGEFRDGAMHGHIVETTSDGYANQTRSEGEYRKGLKQGRWIEVERWEDSVVEARVRESRAVEGDDYYDKYIVTSVLTIIRTKSIG